jgi:hypothetical protein
MPGKGASRFIAVTAVAAWLLVAAPVASAFVYWGDSEDDWIGRASNDGSGINPNFIKTGEEPVGVAVDGSHIYWADQDGNAIGRANIDGSGVDNSFIAGIAKPSGVAVNGSHVFWDTLGGTVGKAELSGAIVNAKLVSGLSEPCGIALDAGHAYWAEIATGTPAYIARVGLDGSVLQQHYVTIPGTSFPCGVAVNSSNIFWTDVGFFGGGARIGRANTNTGEGVDASLIGNASAPCGAALDGAHLYWANSEGRTIGRANTDATAVDEGYIATGGGAICGVAVDSLAPPPNPAPAGGATPPQTTISSGPGKKLAAGIARFRFRSSAAGSHFLCKLDRRKAAGCKSPKAYRRLKAGRHVFRVWAIDAAGSKDPTPAERRFRTTA